MPAMMAASMNNAQSDRTIGDGFHATRTPLRVSPTLRCDLSAQPACRSRGFATNVLAESG